MSGFTPHRSIAKSLPVRPIPVCTSSMMRAASRWSQIARAASRYSWFATCTPPSPWTASRRIAAVSKSTALSRASMSLKGTCWKPGTRGSNGSRNSRRQVALSAPIVRPWKPRMAATIFGRPVDARANLIAASTDSEPELLRNTRFRFGGATDSSFSTNSAFAADPNEGPTWMSSRAWFAIASTMAGLQWPRFPTPRLAPQSMYSFPESSHRVAMEPRTKVMSRFGELANSTARASGAITRGPSPSRPGPAPRDRVVGMTRSRPDPHRLRGPPPRRSVSSSSSRTRSP